MVRFSPVFVILINVFFFLFDSDASAASRRIPKPLINEFTLNGQIPVSYNYKVPMKNESIFYQSDLFNSNIQKALSKQPGFLEETDVHLYRALDDFADRIRGEKVAVIGSKDAWYESILLAYGANPVVIDSMKINSSDSRVTYLTFEEFAANPQKFALILSLTKIADEGLGLDGSPIDPNADLKSMQIIRDMLEPNGLLMLAVPVGPDRLVWNSHRIYGQKRLKMLVTGWKNIRYYGFTSEHVFFGIGYRPVFLVTPK